MMKLIKLELKKNNLKPYLLGVLGIFVAVIAIGMIFCAIPVLEPNDPMSKQFTDPNMIITMASIMSMSAFSILAAIMHSKFVVEEYTGKKNVLLFTYPQKRSRILFAKFALIFGFVFSAMFILNTLACVNIGIIGSAVGLISQPFTTVGAIVKYSAAFALVANFIGLIALRIGFYKKSIIVPIVVATVLTSPFSNMVMMFKDNSFMAFMVVGLILLLVSMFLFIGLLKKVNRMECIS